MKTNAGPAGAGSVCTPGQREPAGSRPRSLVARLGLLTPLALGAAVLSPQLHAQGYTVHEGRVGLVAEADVDYGGDNIIDIWSTDGTRTKVSSGQGITLALGAHYRPAGFPIDFAGTVGYKFIGTEDRNSDLGLYRVVFKVTGTYELPGHFYVDLGPVWHVDTKLKGDGFVADIPYDNAVGATAGFGWRFVGVSYTYIRYRSTEPVSDVDGSNIGVNLTFKF